MRTVIFMFLSMLVHLRVDGRAMLKHSDIDTTKNMIKKAEEDNKLVIDNTTNQLRVRKTADTAQKDGKVPKNNALLKSGSRADYEDDDYDYVAPIINIKFKRSAEDNRTNRMEKTETNSRGDELLDVKRMNSRPLEVRSNSSLTKSHRRKNRRRKQKQQKENIS
jgi:hypothetical protein